MESVDAYQTSTAATLGKPASMEALSTTPSMIWQFMINETIGTRWITPRHTAGIEGCRRLRFMSQLERGQVILDQELAKYPCTSLPSRMICACLAETLGQGNRPRLRVFQLLRESHMQR